MIETIIISVFVLGYLAIAFEHSLKIDKLIELGRLDTTISKIDRNAYGNFDMSIKMPAEYEKV